MVTRKSSHLAILLTLMGLVLVGSGCGMRTSRTAKIQADWSRGEKIGIAGWNQPGGIVAEPDGQSVHLAWISRGPERLGLSYARLDETGQVAVARTLDSRILLPRELRLARPGTGKLLLFTRASPSVEAVPGVNLLVLEADGTPAGPMQLLSRAGAEVQAFDVAVTPDDRVAVVWATGPEDGGRLEYLLLDGDGRVSEPAMQITSEASDPALTTDQAGTVHLAWEQKKPGQRRELYYATFPAPEPQPTAGTHVATFAGGTGTTFEQPVVGLDSRNVYILWARAERAGLEPGTGQTYYVSFPHGQPAYLDPIRIQIPEAGTPEYQRHEGAYNLQYIAGLPGHEFVGTDTLRMASPVSGQRPELAVLLSGNMEFGRASQVTPILVVFADGKVAGYQVVARSDQLAIFPKAAADAAGNLHAMWLTASAEGYDVHYASTAPAAKTALDTTDSSDWIVLARNTVWGMLSGLALFAMLPIIYLPALAVLTGYAMFGGGESVAEEKPRRVLFLAIGLYLVTKVVVWYGMLVNPPLRGLVPASLDPVLMIGIPLLIMAVSALITRWVLRRRERVSLYMAAALFCGLDSVLTMLLYGPSAFGIG